jgi:hypothetical protein
MEHMSDVIKKQILRSFDDVGATKAIGYLPKKTILDLLALDIDQIRTYYEVKGLKTKMFDERETCIKSGAMFVYDRARFDQIVEKFKVEIVGKGWLAESGFVLDQIATHWFEGDDPILPLIRALYGE